MLQTSIFGFFAKDSKFILNKSNIAKENNNIIVEKNLNNNTKNRVVTKKFDFKIINSFCFIYNAIYFLLFYLNKIYLV